GDARLIGGHDVHDHAALEHLRQTHLEAELILVTHRLTPLRAHALALLNPAAGSPSPSARRRSTIPGVTVKMRSTSASVFPSPSENRTLACASSGRSPSARSTCDG